VVVLAAGVLPHPPLLVPELAAGAASLVAPLLAACDAVVAGVLERSPETVVLIGSGRHTGRHAPEETGTLAGFGVLRPRDHAQTGGGDPAAPEQRLPLSLTIGHWLLQRAGWNGRLVAQEVAAGEPTADCAELGVRLVTEAGPASVWLVLGDGSTRRGPRSPGHDDPRAAGFDAGVARAFASGDPGALLALDPELATELGAAGRPGWQVLAGAVAAAPGWAAIDARVHYDAAPFGVEYLVADWAPRS
jgi:hypothetical protein